MRWEVINVIPQPKCDFCGYNTEQMARFDAQTRPNYPIYICSSCARFVKDCMDQWKDLKSTYYIENDKFKKIF